MFLTKSKRIYSGISQRDCAFYEYMCDQEVREKISATVKNLWDREIREKWETPNCAYFSQLEE